jgi:hypothetical protein
MMEIAVLHTGIKTVLELYLLALGRAIVIALLIVWFEKRSIMRIILYLLLGCLFYGCDFREREAALQKKETALNEQEQQLLLREKTVALKEADVLKRERLLDSTLHTDTSQIVNPVLAGGWNVKMTCTETSCAGSAVGDTRNEKWQMHYQGSTLIAKAMANEQLVRVYTGFYTGNTIELVEDKANASVPSVAKMVVRLRMVDSTRLEGEREIVRDNNCKIVYATHMEKITE